MKLFTPILFLVIAVTLFFWYIDPTYANIQKLLSEQSQIDHALSRSKELQDVRDQLLARYNTFPQAELDRLQKLLPDHVDNVRLILDLDSMATRYGMRVRNVTISGDQTRIQAGEIGPSDNAYESVVLSFTVTGPYTVFREYLADLERSLRLVDVVGIDFQSNATGIYDYTLDVKTYWLKP
jgi:hypothetical protein